MQGFTDLMMENHLFMAGWERSPMHQSCNPNNWWHRPGNESYSDTDSAFRCELLYPEKVRQLLMKLHPEQAETISRWNEPFL